MSPKCPVMDNEVQGIIMKVLDSENYRGCKYIGDVLAIIVRYMLDRENYPGDKNFPPIEESGWSYCYRFLVKAISSDVLLILDSVQKTRILVQREFLKLVCC